MRLRALLAALVLLAPAAVPLRAQGIIVPSCRDCRPWVPGRPPFPNVLPVQSVQVETGIQGQVATTHVTQVFRNETDLTLEGTYLFPIPERASIAEFAIWDGERRIAGEVRSREEARRIYDGIVRRRRDPGLLEYAGQDLFQASIFPIPPRGTKKLEITYTQVLAAEGGTVGYRYALGTGRGFAPPERVSARVEIRGDRPIGAVYSPTHDVEVRRGEGDRRATVSFETGRRSERRDFQLFFSPAAGDVAASLVTYREPGKDGYFLLLLSPRSDATEREYAAKDVVYVLDTSGSMREEGKIDKAKRALEFGVRGLGPEDRFNVISFAGETRLMETGLIRADATGRARGVQFVRGLTATGGTNIDEALTDALRQFPADGTRPRLLVFLTDGLPTVGETDPERILTHVRAAAGGHLRLFSFGVGYDVNTRLLDRVAAENGGTADYVEPQEDLEAKVSRFFDKVNHPVLTDLALDAGGVRTDLVYPRALPDLFRGSQVALVGRYRNPADLRDVALRLTGTAGRERRTFTYAGMRFPLRAEANDFLPRLWATRRVGWLMEQIRTHGEARELRDEVVDLGTRYGIVTPYTSFLAVEPGMEDRNAFSGNGDAGALQRRTSGGMPMPAPPPPPSSPAPNVSLEAVVTTSGQAAVQQSRRDRAQQDAVTVDSVAAAGVRRVGEKTFYLRGGVWTDADLRADAGLPVTEVRFGSDAYFALLQRAPRLARWFALGERVAVVMDGRVYRSLPASATP
ncbi:MAG: Vault protein inter-alpha-trypsin domain protein [Gemmatimonadetes bacterium]|nr:Vault protein inter-alpha-trypsin domain protein [Gemmatimonadota bacterium]